jgi:hypothetical protein
MALPRSLVLFQHSDDLTWCIFQSALKQWSRRCFQQIEIIWPQGCTRRTARAIWARRRHLNVTMDGYP